MNKLEMAHQYFMQTMGFIRNNNIDHNFDDVVSESWDYVYAMQAEADKREKQKAIDDAESSKVFFEKLTGSRALQQTFIDGIEQPRYSDDQWQPDWSQAPEWANWAAVGPLSNKWIWSAAEPEHINIQGVDYWDVTSPHAEEHGCYSTLTNYTGDWRDSVRKRP